MGLHRTPEQIKPEIIKGTMRLVAEGGINNFSFPKLSVLTGITAPTVYEHYKDKRDLFERIFFEIDIAIACLMQKAIAHFPGTEITPEKLDGYCWLMWNVYWNFLMENADRTQFYWNFYNSEYYTDEIYRRRTVNFKAFVHFVDTADKQVHVSDNHNRELVVSNIIDGTVSAAIKVFKNHCENNKTTARTVYKMVFQPLFSIIESEKKKMNGE